MELAHPEMRGWLQQLSDSLEPSDFHFAYRSYNEILMFVANAQQAPWFDGFERSAQAAFDAACLCKVLSKISGGRGRVESPLLEVLAWALNPAAPSPEAAASAVSDSSWDPLSATLPATAAKARKMLRRARDVGFASYA